MAHKYLKKTEKSVEGFFGNFTKGLKNILTNSKNRKSKNRKSKNRSSMFRKTRRNKYRKH